MHSQGNEFGAPVFLVLGQQEAHVIGVGGRGGLDWGGWRDLTRDLGQGPLEGATLGCGNDTSNFESFLVS